MLTFISFVDVRAIQKAMEKRIFMGSSLTNETTLKNQQAQVTQNYAELDNKIKILILNFITEYFFLSSFSKYKLKNSICITPRPKMNKKK